MPDLIRTLTIAEHVAHLDVETGGGLLVCPPASPDVWLDGESIQGARWADVLHALDRMGWEPTEGEDGGLSVDGYTLDGGAVVGLYGRDPIRSEPSLEDSAAAYAGLLALAGLSGEPATDLTLTGQLLAPQIASSQA